MTGVHQAKIGKAHIYFYIFLLHGHLWNRLLISQNKLQFIEMYDGPHTFCKQLNHFEEKMASSTFQVLILINAAFNCSSSAIIVNFTQVQAERRSIFLDKEAQGISHFECPDARHRMSEHCVLKLEVQRNFYVKILVNVSFTGFVNDDCMFGAFAAFTQMWNTTAKILKMCVGTIWYHSIVSTTNNMLLAKYSYDFLTVTNYPTHSASLNVKEYF